MRDGTKKSVLWDSLVVTLTLIFQCLHSPFPHTLKLKMELLVGKTCFQEKRVHIWTVKLYHLSTTKWSSSYCPYLISYYPEPLFF